MPVSGRVGGVQPQIFLTLSGPRLFSHATLEPGSRARPPSEMTGCPSGEVGNWEDMTEAGGGRLHFVPPRGQLELEA